MILQRSRMVAAVLICFAGAAPSRIVAASQTQQPAPAASASSRVLGTLVSRTADSLTIKPDTGDTVTVALPSGSSVLTLPPGSKDLKAAQPATAADLELNDRVLVLLDSAAGTPTARRVLVMKGAAIAAQQQTAEQGWAHSQGGVVDAVDAASSSFTIKSGARTVTVSSTPTTVFRRYAPGSVRYQDAKPATLAELHAGDQVRVRCTSTATSMTAEEVVFGSFRQIGGEVVSIDPANGSFTLRDSSTKQPVVVMLTPHTDLHALPPALAKQLAAGPPHAAHGAPAAQPESSAAAPQTDPASAISQLPTLPASSLKAGDAVLCVATSGPGHVNTATLVLTGAAPILASMQSGGSTTALSAWSLGGGSAAATE